MRRSLIRTVAAAVVIVIVALLVPMALLVNEYALEDRLARAALEVQATETVVSGQDKGSVSVYLDQANDNDLGIRTTVLYPDGTAVGPAPGEDDRVSEARRTGQARVDNESGGAQILVPVSLGGSSGLPANTPVIRVQVLEAGFADEVRNSWVLLGLLGLALLVATVLVADRLARSFVQPVLDVAERARRLSAGDRSGPAPRGGPPEVADVAAAFDTLVRRVDDLLASERAAVTDLAHRLRTPVTRLRLEIDTVGLTPSDRARLADAATAVTRTVDEVIREARRTEREGLGAHADLVAVIERRTAFWRPLAEDQHREFRLHLPRGPLHVRATEADIETLIDALLENAFAYTPDGAGLALAVQPGDPVELVVTDAGEGFSAGVDSLARGGSTGSTGLGLDIVRRTAEATGGGIAIGRSDAGGAKVTVRLGRGT